MLDAVGIELGIRDLEIEHRVDLHGDIILGDHGLGREVHDLFLQRHDFCYALKEGNFKMETHGPGGAVSAQTFDHIGLGLLDDFYVQYHNGQNDNHNNNQQNDSDGGHSFFLLTAVSV